MHHKVFGIIKGTVLPNLVKKWKYCLYSGSAPANLPFYTVRSFFSFGPAREFFVVQKFITSLLLIFASQSHQLKCNMCLTCFLIRHSIANF